MVEALKFLNYCQLAKNSLVSMRFRNRFKLSDTSWHFSTSEILEFILSRFLVSSKFSIKSSLLTHTTAGSFETNTRKKFHLKIKLHKTFQTVVVFVLLLVIKIQTIVNKNDRTDVYFAQAELNHDNWPVFQHFVRLATDLFIYIDCMGLTLNVLNSLSRAINPNRLQCKELNFDHRGNIKKPPTWTKNHVKCNQLCTNGKVALNQDEAMLDFFVTGGLCTSAIQKFMNLTDSNESQLVDAIEGYLDGKAVESLKRTYAKFVVKDERHGHITEQIFEFANNDIGKKLQLIAKNRRCYLSFFSIKINNL